VRDTGIFAYGGHAGVDRVLPRLMTDILGHRGPDGDGFHFAPGLGLGHRRLAIVDLVTDDQPLFSEDRTVCVVYNGEIDNFQSLVTELMALGINPLKPCSSASSYR
jgi:asparagine synthase (glutamine-hydrolysing)